MDITFPDAHELPNSRVRPSSKHVGSKGGGNGTKKKNPDVPPVRPDQKKRDHEITEANKMVMLVSPTGHRRFMKLSEYRRTA